MRGPPADRRHAVRRPMMPKPAWSVNAAAARAPRDPANLWFNTVRARPSPPCSAFSSPASASIIPTFIGMTLLAFFLIRIVPGDPIETMAGERGIDPARHAALLKEYGLDRPVLVQYGIYIGRVLHGDLGKSMITQEPVLSEFARAVPGHHRARAVRDRVRARHRHSRRDAGRGASQLGVRPRRHGRVAHRLFDADLLVGAAADPAVLGAARLDAGVRPHRGQVLHRAGHRLPDDRRAALRREGRVPVGGVAPDPADDRARHQSARDHRADDALGDARGAGRGLHPHRAGQGPVEPARDRAARVSQCADPGHHRDRPAGRRAVHRRDPDRDHLLLARRRQVADRGDQPPRLSGAAGRPAACSASS